MSKAQEKEKEVLNGSHYELVLRLAPQFAAAIQSNPLHEDLTHLHFIVWKHGLALQRTRAKKTDTVVGLGPIYKIVSGGKTVFANTPSMHAIKADLEDVAFRFKNLIQAFECVDCSDRNKDSQNLPKNNLQPLPLTA